MATLLTALALIVSSFLLGMCAAARFYAWTFRELRKYRTEIAIEDREEGMIAIVMQMPAEFRALAEKIVKKTREQKEKAKA